MASVSEVREKLSELLADQISLDQFEDWFLPYSWNIHKRANQEVQRLVYAIEHALSEFDEDSIALRKELANAVRPFAPRHREMVVFLKAQPFQYPEGRAGASGMIEKIRKPPTSEIALGTSAMRSVELEAAPG